MWFCKKCGNMYYLKLSTETENELVHYCRHCGDEDTSASAKSVSVSKIVLKGETTVQGHHMYINEYTKLDPTIPRTDVVSCPNVDCVCNSLTDPVEKDILYVRYDDNNMRYIYMCCHCDTTWKSNTI